MAIIGYIRVSTSQQNSDRQLDGLQLDRVYEDKCSGKDLERIELSKCLDFCRDGDTLLVHSMDRLSRNLIDLENIVNKLTAKGVTVEFVKENLKFTGENDTLSKLMLQIMGSVAQFERSRIKERAAEGMAIAMKDRTKYIGKQSKLTKEQEQEILKLWNTDLSKTAIGAQFGLTRSGIYKTYSRISKK